jgi:hypothetical protein
MAHIISMLVLLCALSAAGQFASPADMAFLSKRRVAAPLPDPPFTNTVGLVVWLKPESLPASSSVVSLWADSSGSGNDFTNSATVGPAGTGPICVANALNGFKSARFFRTNVLVVPNYSAPSVIPLGFSNSVVLVFKTHEATGNNYQVMGSGPFDFSWSINPDDGLSITDDGSAGIARSDDAQPISLSGFSFLEWTRQDSATPVAVFYQNSTSLGFRAGDTALGGAESTLDRLAEGYEWEVVEVFVWTHPLTTDERAGLRIYLAAKFGL